MLSIFSNLVDRKVILPDLSALCVVTNGISATMSWSVHELSTESVME